MTYRQQGKDFIPGPISDSSGSSSNYDIIYRVTKDEINAHIKNPANASGSILDWPGNGDTSKGEPYQLAPFIDVNSNGKYEPTMGDYPKIKGIAATYCVYNDKTVHTASTGQPILIEVHQMFYQDSITHNGLLIDDVNLASFTLINRGPSSISDFVFGIYTDFDLGNHVDDFVGSDSVRNMVYVYNADDEDEGIRGYGLNPPAQSMMFLNHRMGSAISFNNNYNPVDGNPSIASDYYKYLNARFKDGSLLNHPMGYITKYAFSGDPVRGTGWIEKDTTGVSPGGDRRMVAGSEPFKLNPNEPICFDIAYVHGRIGLGGPKASIDVMREKADIVQSAYNHNTYGWKTSNCQLGANEQETTGIFYNHQKAHFYLYPNPSMGLYHIENLKTNGESRITDPSGKTVRIIQPEANQIDIQDLESGVYFLQTELGTFRLLKL